MSAPSIGRRGDLASWPWPIAAAATAAALLLVTEATITLGLRIVADGQFLDIVDGLIIRGLFGSLAAIAWLLSRRLRAPTRMIPNRLRVIGAVAAVVYGSAFLILWASWGPSFGQTATVPAQRSASLWVAAISAATLVPVGEEILFRRLLYGQIRHWAIERDPIDGLSAPARLRVVAPSIIVSSIAFALAHVDVAGSALAVVATIPVGIVLTVVYEVSGRLWASVLAHAALNGIVSANVLSGPDGGSDAALIVLAVILVLATVLAYREPSERMP